MNLLDILLVVIVGASIAAGFAAGFARVGIGFIASFFLPEPTEKERA